MPPLDCTVQWFLVYSQYCATIYMSNLAHLYYLSRSLPLPGRRSLVPSSWSWTTGECPLSAWICCSGHFSERKSDNTWPSVLGFFDSAWCVLTLLRVWTLHSFKGWIIFHWKQWQILFSWAPKSLWTVTAAMKLEDACSSESCGKPRWCIKKQRHHFADKGPYSQSYVFPVVMYESQSWTIRKAECWRTDAFELWWRRLLRVTRTARRSNQS